MSLHRIPSVALLLAVLVAAALAGCGDSSTASAPHRTSAAPVAIAPPGAPYRYTVPPGFKRVPASFPGGGARYLTTMQLTGHVHMGTLSVFQWTLDDTQRGYSTERLLAWLDRQTQAFYRSTGATVSAGTRTRVTGHAAICWRIGRFRNAGDGLVDGEGCAIVGSHDVVQQGCTWKPGTHDLMRRGCRELRASLRIL